MEILHTEETQVLEPPDLGGSGDLAGVARFEDADRPGAIFHQQFNQSTIELYLGSDQEYVLGAYEEDITAILERRNPCEDVTCSHVLRMRKWEYREHSSHSWPRWKEHQVAGWAVFDKPVCTSDDPDVWVRASQLSGGPIYVLEELADVTLDNAGLTCSIWHNGMWRVNYNPRAIALRPHRAALKEYKHRMRGHAPDEHMHSLMRAVTSFNHDSELYGVAETLEVSHNRGWGRRSAKEFSEEDVLKAAKVMSKLGPKFWRERDIYSNPFESVAEYVHGIEAHVAEKREDSRQKRLDSYLAYLRDYNNDPKFRETRRCRPFNEKRRVKFKHWNRNFSQEKAWRERLKFCRWIRTEMRARKEKMPDKPVKPTLKKRCKKKRSSRGRSKKKRSNIRTSTAPSRSVHRTEQAETKAIKEASA